MKKYDTLQQIVDQLELVEYQTLDTNHSLKINAAFAALKRMAKEQPVNIYEVEADRMKWSLKTFTEATTESSLLKAESEIREIKDDHLIGRRNPTEYADAIMCLFDSAARQGITVIEIFEAYKEKVDVNKTRIWAKNDDNSYSHIKPLQEPSEALCHECQRTTKISDQDTCSVCKLPYSLAK